MPNEKIVLAIAGLLVVSLLIGGTHGYFSHKEVISGNVFTAWIDEEPLMMTAFSMDDSINVAQVVDAPTEIPVPEDTPNRPEFEVCESGYLGYCVSECQHTCENCGETCEQDCKAKIELECVVTPEETPTIDETPEETPTEEITVEPTEEITVEPTPTEEITTEPTPEETPTEEITVEPTEEVTPTEEITVEPTPEETPTETETEGG
jgi:predicted ribosomally synthesized peptide with SipW-like signal peptide